MRLSVRLCPSPDPLGQGLRIAKHFRRCADTALTPARGVPPFCTVRCRLGRVGIVFGPEALGPWGSVTLRSADVQLRLPVPREWVGRYQRGSCLFRSGAPALPETLGPLSEPRPPLSEPRPQPARPRCGGP